MKVAKQIKKLWKRNALDEVPKCGGQMEEVALEGIMIDKCTECQGIYFDNGELEVLMGHRESDSFIGKLVGFMKK